MRRRALAKAPQRKCRKVSCHVLTRDRYCPQHAGELQCLRGSPESRGYDSRWKRERAAFLEHHPWCTTCQVAQGVLIPATVVDHIVPHRGNPDLMWNESNWQPLCASCHGRKTAKYDGGFGNPTKEHK